jgi:hypothetical protein
MTNPKLQAKIDAAEFQREVALSADSIRQACRRAAEAGKVRANSTVKEVDDLGNAVVFRVKNTMGPTIALLQVTWEPSDDTTRVQFEVLEYTTTRPAVAGFIPAGPKSIPALKSIQRFSEALRLELGAAAT